METTDASNPTKKSAGLHLDFLHGLRGLAALYVVFHHAYSMLMVSAPGQKAGIASQIMGALRPLAFGHYAVDLFIVLSGYCLMLPILLKGGELRGGFMGYIQRRARRILPPYYAALIFSFFLVRVLHFWLHASRIPNAHNFIAHIFLVHNLSNAWVHGYDPPMWSVATEWQIYFLFPLFLLPLWKKTGIGFTVIAGYVVGLAAHWLTPRGLNGAAPWFIGLFALGMAGATINFPLKSEPRLQSKRVPWGTLALLLCCGLAVVGTIVRGWFLTHPWLIDPIFGLAAMCLIIYCVQASASYDPQSYPFALRILKSRWAITLGAFSYSLYLTHYPLLNVASILMGRGHLSPLAQVVVMFGIYVPATLGFAYLFYLLFERPFMPGQHRTADKSKLAIGISPTS